MLTIIEGKAFLDGRVVDMDKAKNRRIILHKLTLKARHGDTEAAKDLLHQMSLSYLDPGFIGICVFELNVDQVNYDYDKGVMIEVPFNDEDHIGCKLCGCIIYPSTKNKHMTNCPYCNVRWVKPQIGSNAWLLKSLGR